MCQKISGNPSLLFCLPPWSSPDLTIGILSLNLDLYSNISPSQFLHHCPVIYICTQSTISQPRRFLDLHDHSRREIPSLQPDIPINSTSCNHIATEEISPQPLATGNPIASTRHLHTQASCRNQGEFSLVTRDGISLRYRAIHTSIRHHVNPLP